MLISAWRQNGVKPKELADMPKLGRTAARVWSDYLDLHVTRRSGLDGPERIGWVDLQARQIVTGHPLEPWAIRAIFRMEAEWSAFRSREAAKSRGA